MTGQRIVLSEKPFAGTASPARLMVDVQGTQALTVLAAETGALHAVPGVEPGRRGHRAALSPDGRFIVAEQFHEVPDGSKVVHTGGGPRVVWRPVSLGLFRMRVADLTMERATYEPGGPGHDGAMIGVSPDGGRLAVLDREVRDDPCAPTRVLLVGFDGTPPRELMRFPGHGIGDVDDVEVQWSPDGTRVAVSVREPDEGRLTAPPTEAYRRLIDEQSVRVLDVATGAEVVRLPGHTLMGSASWSPDSTRLLVVGNLCGVYIADLATGAARYPRCLEAVRREPPTKVPRPIGFADDTHVLSANQRGMVTRLWCTDLEGGSDDPTGVEVARISAHPSNTLYLPARLADTWLPGD